jgi:L-threonylcarbamoyladenylate synthase
MSAPAAATPGAIVRAGEIVQAGGLVAFPTETVYGLGADATNDRAVARIFAAKGRPSFNPLIVHVGDLAAAERLATFDARARRLAARFWPGPLTLVLPRAPASPVSRLATAGLETLAVRVPAHPVAAALLAAAARPLAAPSANPSGRLSPTRAAHVAEGLGAAVDFVLDGGACPGGLESTVLDLTGPAPLLLRPGLVAQAALEAALGAPVAEAPAGDAAAPASPGRLAQHYAPATPLRLDATEVGANEALLAFGPRPPAGAAIALNLSAGGDLVEAAANLFAHLHALDAEARRRGLAAIAAMPVPGSGLGAAIRDRLARAAARA